MTKGQVVSKLRELQPSLDEIETVDIKNRVKAINEFAFNNMSKWWSKVITEYLDTKIDDGWQLNNLVNCMISEINDHN